MFLQVSLKSSHSNFPVKNKSTEFDFAINFYKKVLKVGFQYIDCKFGQISIKCTMLTTIIKTTIYY